MRIMCCALSKCKPLYILVVTCLLVACVSAEVREEITQTGESIDSGLLQLMEGSLAAADDAFQDALTRADRLGMSSQQRSELLLVFSLVAMYNQGFELAERYLNEAQAIVEQAGSEQAIVATDAISLALRGELQRKQGNYGEAKRLFIDALDAFVDVRDFRVLGVIGASLAHTQYELGQIDDALNNYEYSIPILKGIADSADWPDQFHVFDDFLNEHLGIYGRLRQ